MNAKAFRWLGLIAGLTVVAGCHNSAPTGIGQSFAVAEPCSLPLQLPVVFYDETGTPSEKTPTLSQLELSEIVNAVAAQTTDSIWLIRVRPSQGVERNAVTVYLAPQKETSRIRQGRAFDVWISGQEVRVSPPTEYIQVSKPTQPFAGPLTLPPRDSLPFRRPTVTEPDTKTTSPVPEEDVIEIVDFVRQPSIYRSVGFWPPAERKMMIREVQELPILGIGRERDTIHVRLGYMHGALWGYGQDITLKRTPFGYKVVDWTMWIS
jgi:predicted small lipoprotein YifL